MKILSRIIFGFGLSTFALGQGLQNKPIDRVVHLTIGSADRLPPGTNVKCDLKIQTGELDSSNSHGSVTFEEFSNKKFITSDITYNTYADASGVINAQSFDIRVGALPSSVSNGKKYFVFLEIHTIVSINNTALMDKITIIPVIIQEHHRNIIPVCISVFNRDTGNGKSWGISRHNCEDPLDFSKRKAIPK